MRALAPQELQRGLPVTGDVQVRWGARAFESFGDHQYVAGVVLDEQDDRDTGTGLGRHVGAVLSERLLQVVVDPAVCCTGDRT
ncbi:hypothetical protein Kisp01_23900 [Kineosporia sp. NBRC 101677]|nr:hypothetical protein Kisp01_23900 [Kineosporia sp. NBRC 101677]